MKIPNDKISVLAFGMCFEEESPDAQSVSLEGAPKAPRGLWAGRSVLGQDSLCHVAVLQSHLTDLAAVSPASCHCSSPTELPKHTHIFSVIF